MVEELRRDLKSAGGGQGSFTVLTGDSGVGKFDVMDAALDRQGIDLNHIHVIRASREETDRPFSGIAPLVRRAAQIPHARSTTVESSLFLTPLLRGPTGTSGAISRSSSLHRSGIASDLRTPGLGSTPGTYQDLLADLEFYKRGVEAWGDRSRFIHEVGEAILQLAEESLTVLLFDDGQFLDTHSWAVLRYLSERLESAPLVVWVAVDLSPGGTLPPHVEGLLGVPQVRHLVVPPLSRQGVEQLIGRWVPRSAVSPQFVDLVLHASRGMPQSVEQLVRGRQGAAARLMSSVEEPEDVVDLAQTRVRRLPQGARDVISRVSLLGPSFTSDLARSVVEGSIPELRGSLSYLVREGFLRQEPDGAFSFSVHQLSDRLRDDLPANTRRKLHRKIAESLETSTLPSSEDTLALADHWYEAGDWEHAARANLEATRLACDTYAPDSALRYADRVLEALGHMDSPPAALWGEVLTEKGRALYDLDRLKEARKTLELALKKVGSRPEDWPLRARALFHLARTLGGLGKGEETFALVKEASAGLDATQDLRGRLMLHQVVGVSLMMIGENAAAAKHFREMLRLAEAMDEPREKAYAEKNLSAVLLSMDPHDAEGMALVQAALAYHTRTKNYAGLAAGYFNRGLTYLDLKQEDTALADMARSKEAGEKAHAPSLVASAVLQAASIHMGRGETAAALADLDGAEPWIGAVEGPWARVSYALLRGQGAEARGDLTEAGRLYERALQEAEVGGAPSDTWEPRLRRAHVAERMGRPEVAHRLFSELPPEREIIKARADLTELYRTVKGRLSG